MSDPTGAEFTPFHLLDEGERGQIVTSLRDLRAYVRREGWKDHKPKPKRKATKRKVAKQKPQQLTFEDYLDDWLK